MKLRWRSWFEAFQHRVVLTPEEKRVLVFVLVALILGLAAKNYRGGPAQSPAGRQENGSFVRAQEQLAAPAKSPEKPRKKPRAMKRDP